MENNQTVRHIIPISGKDSLATAIIQRTLHPEVPYEYVYNDTRMELPETYEWLLKVEEKLGIKITRLGKSLADIIAKNRILPSPRTRYCTRESKIFPMQAWIGKDEAMLYIGIRADEDRVGAKEEINIAVSYPLRDLGLGLESVYGVVNRAGLMPPAFFWKRLYDAVVVALGGGMPSVIAELPKWIFDRTFAWRSRPNCFMCFYQRRYEWLGLMEHHPELFTQAEELEKRWGNTDASRLHPYYFISENFPLSEVRRLKNDLFQKRVNAVVQMLSKRLQKDLFVDALIDDMELANKSCGIFCGK